MVNDKKAFLMEACIYRHHPAIRKIERIVSGESIGQIDSIRAVFSNFEPEDELSTDGKLDWRFRKECGGGVAYDWMSCCVNACNHFSGSKLKRVFATGNISPKYGIVNRVYAMLEYENGTVGIIESSKSAGFSQMLQLTCAYGILKLPVAWGIYGDVVITKEHRKEKWDYILSDRYQIEEADSFYLQMRNFCNVIKGSEKPVIPLSESIVNVCTIDAIIKSITQKKLFDIVEPF